MMFGCFSDQGKVNHGVAQSSILGPLLVIMYINDLLSRLSAISETLTFTDDIIVTNSGGNFNHFP